MKDIIKNIENVYDQLVAKRIKYEGLLENLKLREDGIAQREENLALKEQALIEREKNIIPSERLINREIECDKKYEEAQAMIRDVQLRASNNTKANEQLRRDIETQKRHLLSREADLKDAINKFEVEKRNWKSKLIAKMQEDE